MKLSRTVFFSALAGAFILISMTPPAFPEDGGEKRFGVIHNIAEDRKVERVGGIYEPEGLDKYIKRRLDAVDSKLETLSSGLAEANMKLDAIQAGLEKDSGKDEATLVS